jgi:hypothetical protein
VLLPFLYLGTGQLLSFFDYHQARGLQIESVPAGVVLFWHLVSAAPVTVVYNFGAFHLSSHVADTIVKLLPYLTILAFALVILSCLMCFRHELKQRGVVTHDILLVWLMSIILTFIVMSKVFSPQFISWLLPFASFLKLRQIILIIIIFAMTLVLYPVVYGQLLALRTPPILLLNVRNILMIVLLIWLIGERLPLWITAGASS